MEKTMTFAIAGNKAGNGDVNIPLITTKGDAIRLGKAFDEQALTAAQSI